MAKAKLDASWNEASGIAKVMPDAIMDDDVNGMPLGNEEINGVGKLQFPTLARINPAQCVKNIAVK